MPFVLQDSILSQISRFALLLRLLGFLQNLKIFLGFIALFNFQRSLAFTISVAEMFSTAKALASSTTSMMPFVAAALFYYIFNFLVAALMDYTEKKMDYYK